jgi:hypothetical protein
MFEIIKMMSMFIGFLFSLGITGFVIFNRKNYEFAPMILTIIVALIGALLFLGQFVSKIGG